MKIRSEELSEDPLLRGECPPGDLAGFLPYQLSIASNAVSVRIAEQYYTRFGLKIPEWRVMAVLGDSAGARAGTQGGTQRELAEATLMDKVAVNRACKALTERGLAQRQPHEDDGRSHHLALTEAGREVHGRIMPLAKAMEAQLFAGFSGAEREQFAQLLDRLQQAAVGSL